MRNFLIALVLLVTALTFYSALRFKSNLIEADITDRVTQDLADANAEDVTIDVDGRHVTLSGVVYDETTEASYLQTADETYGALGPIDGLTYLADGGFVTATKDVGGITLNGTVPTPEARASLVAAAQEATDGEINDMLTVSGPAADWQGEAAFGLTQLGALTTGTLTASEGTFALSGNTDGDADSMNSSLGERDGWVSFVSSSAPMDDLSDDVARLTQDISDKEGMIAELEGTVSERDATIVDLTSQRDMVGTELSELQASLTAGQTDSANLQAQLTAREAELGEANAVITEKDVIIDGLNGQITDFEAELANRGEAIGATSEENLALQGELDAANQSVVDLTAEVEARDQTIADLSGTIDESTATIEGLNGDVAERDETIASLRQAATDSESDQVAALNAQISDRDGTIDGLNGQIADLTGQVGDRDGTIDGLNGQIADLTGQVGDRDGTIDALNADLGAANSEVARLEGELDTQGGSLTQSAAQIALLSSLTEAGDAEVESLQGEITDLTAVVAERDATIASMQTPVEPASGIDAAQCAQQANEALEGAQINFDTATATIQGGSVPLLERLTGIALACVGEGGLSVEVGGHTDAQGTDENNQALSEARAQAVVAFMAERGVPTDGLAAVGYGESQPIGDNATSEGRAENRRISFEWQAR